MSVSSKVDQWVKTMAAHLVVTMDEKRVAVMDGMKVEKMVANLAVMKVEMLGDQMADQ